LFAVVGVQSNASPPSAAVTAAPAIDDVTPRAGDQVVARKSGNEARAVAPVMPELGAAYEHTTTPAAVIAGAEMPVEVRVTNTGLRSWPAGGDQPVRLGYHWYDANGTTVLWDGARAALSGDVSSGEETTLDLNVRAPPTNGTYTLAWDLVQEGAGWFSASAVAMKTERIVVGDGVTFYGKGLGHGIGLSQWGAQGWAEGAAGPRLNAEEILAKSFPGADLVTEPQAAPFRVLISAPS